MTAALIAYRSGGFTDGRGYFILTEDAVSGDEAMNKPVIAVFFLTSMAVFMLPLSSWAQGAGGDIHLQDVDTNKDGTVSPNESRAYIRRLEQAHDFEQQQNRNAAKLQLEAERAAAQAAEKADILATPATVQPKPALATVPPLATKTPPQEMKCAVEDAPANDQKKLNKRLQEMKALDLNNDGVLQAAELQSAASQKFEAADTDKDGVISTEEAAASTAHFSQQQQEAYGKAAGKQEAVRVKNRLKNADANRDGQISKEEYETFMNERQSLFDRDGDGIISEEEYRTDGEKLPSSYRKKTRE